MKEDIEVIAKFDGIEQAKYVPCLDCAESWQNTYECCTCCGTGEVAEPNDLPGYPNDMNALLGVMDKMDKMDKENKWIEGSMFTNWASLLSYVCMRWQYGKPLTDLPSVLTPLLADAIRKLNETKS